ncbi:MAG: ArgE/DapE family deacylase [Candidatus Omnitrophica bacterium]|nr:ArgE/DapE family deacylase [Candidatus Omnitrophota bacterium]
MIRKDRLIKLTQKVLSINSENPPGKEARLADFIEKDMKSLGLSVRTYSFEKNRPNIIATLKGSLSRRQARQEALLITPHFDTVPIGHGWKYDPYGSDIVNGRLYGRGATDDKGDLAGSMEVMRSLVEDKVVLKRDVVFAATVDEETGSHCGIIPLLEKKILRPKFALVLDSDELDTIIAQKGLMHLKIQIKGKKAHGAYNWRGVNAIEVATRIINKIKKYKFRYKKHALLHPPTTNIGVITGGDKVNVVADFCEFALDLRYLPGMNSRSILKDIRELIRSETSKFKIVIDDLQLPYEIDRKHPCVKKWVDVAKRLNCKATLKGSEGATVITFFKKYKIPAFATGFGAHGTAHTTDEYIFIKSLYNGTKVLEAYVKAYDNLSF